MANSASIAASLSSSSSLSMYLVALIAGSGVVVRVRPAVPAIQSNAGLKSTRDTCVLRVEFALSAILRACDPWIQYV
eukprot:6190887-Pleurochrysis_carterae.AAC.6